MLRNHKKYDLIIEELGPAPLFLPILFKKDKIIGSVQVILENYSEKRGLLGSALWKLQKKAFIDYDNMLTVSFFAKEKIQSISGKNEIEVIYPGVGLQKVDNLLSKSLKRKEDYIIYLGRLDYLGKGLDILLDALALLENKTHLLLVGNGTSSDKKKIVEHIAKRKLDKLVEFIDYADGKEKTYLIENSLFLCLPSRSEVLGMTILESFYCSRPVVCSKIGGMVELVNNSRGGLLFNNNSSKDLANKLEILISDKKKREKMGLSGKSFVKKLSWKQCAKKTYSFYRRINNK